MKSLLTIFSIFVCMTISYANDIELRSGLTLTSSANIIGKTYTLNAPVSLNEPLIIVEGNNIVIDFKDAILQGSNDKGEPDSFYGLALLIKKGSRNITIKNANIHGFKVAVMADSVENLLIENCDLSYNYRQHLQSNWKREDVSDWMSYHHNEKDEWLRYGAAIYLKNCLKPVITNNTVTGGQCALMITSTQQATVNDNNFSFNSGIGIGLYRSSGNFIYHNRLDFNVRGYSDGKYKRGQDSAGFLVFEQSSDNVFAYNSATHSGDGFFLWAGQSTMDSGKGGCNDNFIYGNDFSYAPTNGIEVTFSRNLIMKNIIKECDHGIWGGYSFDTDITDNTFENNRIGIAIEHGQNFNIALNGFKGDKTAVKLWSREKQPEDWAYPKLRNSESRNYWIAANRFTSNTTAFDIMGTDTVVFSGNTKLFVENNLVLGDRVENIDTSREETMLDLDYQKDDRLKKINVTDLPKNNFAIGKKEMRITEWGPYDQQYPLLWLKEIDSEGLYHFEVLGKSGKWSINNLEGFEIKEIGALEFPSFIVAKVIAQHPYKKIILNYDGPAYHDLFGKKIDSNSNNKFLYQTFIPDTKWDLKFYKWDSAHDPEKDFIQFSKLFELAPFHADTTEKLDFTWWGKIRNDLPSDSFATVASTKILVKEGNYRIGITADDLAKVFIDGKEVINAWDATFTDLDENTHHKKWIHLSAGEHEFKIIHAEKKGLATLMFYLEPE